MRFLSAALAASLLWCAACKPSDPADPKTWQERLSDNEPKVRVKAVQELRKLQAKSAAPAIAGLLKDPLVKEEAALALQDLGGPGEVQPLLDAVDTTVGAGSDQATRATNRTNARLIAALGNIGDARAGPSLLRLARASDDFVRLSAIEALGQVKFREAVPELARIVDDPAAPPLLAKKAIVALGQIGDPAAIPALEHGLVMEQKGVSFLPESSFALFLLGKDAAPPLLKLLQDQDPAWIAWARENNRAPAGTYAKAALVLGDLGDARAAPALLQKLKYSDPDPVPGTAKLLTNLVRQFAANALGRLRAKEAAGPIQALVSTKEGEDDLTGFASEALVWIGERGQAKELLKKAQSGEIRQRVALAQAAALLGDGALGKELSALAAREAKGAPASCQKQLGELGLSADDPKRACETLAAQFSEPAEALEAAKSCAEAASCWLSRMQDKNPVVRARAAYELGRAQSLEAAGPLEKALADDQLPVRAAAVRALDWLAESPAAKGTLKATAPALAAQLSREAGKIQFIKVNEELRRLQVKLSRL